MNFQKPIDAVFNRGGVDAVFTPDGGSSVNITVLPSQPDQALEMFDTNVTVDTSIFKIRATEVIEPKEDDLITINGVDYQIKGFTSLC